MESGLRAPGEIVADRVTWVSNLNDQARDEPRNSYTDEYSRRPKVMRREEYAAIEEQDGDLDKGDDNEVEDAVDVHILCGAQSSHCV